MNIKDYPQGLLFDGKLQAEIKDRFWNVDSDPEAGKRLFFENAGGSLRLKAAIRLMRKRTHSLTVIPGNIQGQRR